MKAKVVIRKSFDESKQFTKEWHAGDFEEFFKEEGEYLDRLSGMVEKRPEQGQLFEVTYTVTVEKGV